MRGILKRVLQFFVLLAAVVFASLGVYFDLNTYVLVELYGKAKPSHMIVLFMVEVIGFIVLTWLVKRLFLELSDPREEGGYFGTKLTKAESKAVDDHRRRRFGSRSKYVRHLIRKDAKV